MNTRDTTSTYATAQIFYLIWRETLKAATSSKGCLKGNTLMHTVCKYHKCAYFPWQVSLKSLKLYISKLIMCDLDRFSEIQSHMIRHLIVKGLIKLLRSPRTWLHGLI